MLVLVPVEVLVALHDAHQYAKSCVLDAEDATHATLNLVPQVAVMMMAVHPYICTYIYVRLGPVVICMLTVSRHRPLERLLWKRCVIWIVGHGGRHLL